jgi:type IV pilus assembly protein PilX
MKFRNKQQGAVMILVLSMLLVMTLIGVSMMDTSITQEKMAQQLYDYQCSFEAAEDALRKGEDVLNATWVWIDPNAELSGTSASGDGVFDVGGLPANWWKNISDSFWTGGAYSYQADINQSSDVDGGCRGHYVIELQKARLDSLVEEGYNVIDTGLDYHSITSRGVGKQGTNEVLLQGTVGKRWPVKS